MYKPEFFEYLKVTRKAEMGVADVKAWLERTGSYGWGRGDVELYLTVILSQMGSRDILSAYFSSPMKSSPTNALLKVVRPQLIAPFRIYHIILQTFRLVGLQNSTRMMVSTVRQIRPSLAVLACTVFRLQPYNLQTISGVLKMTLKSFRPLSLRLPFRSLSFTTFDPDTSSYDPAI